MIKNSVILFQTHILSKDILREFQNISNETEEFCDAYLLCDDTNINIPQKVKNYRHICINKKDLSEFNYPIVKDEKRKTEVPIPEAFNLSHNKLSILKYFLENKGYDYYWYIEYDVRYSGKWSHFFNCFKKNEKDLLISYLRFYEEEPNWSHWYLNHPELTIPKSELIRCFNPIIRFSNKALTYLHESLMDG